MSAVDRIAAIVAKHVYNEWGVEDDYCSCVASVTDSGYPAHVAERITAAADLAVIELPEPINSQEGTEDENGWGVWHSPIAEGPILFDDGEIHYRGAAFKADGVREHAAALLAAAKAAEELDRGNN